MSIQSNPELPEPWHSKITIALHYGVSVRTVERWLYEGCPSMLLGGVRRMQLSEVKRWLREHGLIDDGSIEEAA